jgi:alpha-L-fucosidase
MAMTGFTRDQRLQQWYSDARIGLFISWGAFTGDHVQDPFGPDAKYPYETVEAFEKAAGEAGWSAERWVATAKLLKARYITIASFHCNLGYLKTWFSAVPGSPHTKRDFLKELLDAANAEEIQVIVYINREPKNWNQCGIVWLDKQAYQDYKHNNGIDITTKDGFLDYSMEVIDELMALYPRVAGFWFDGYHDKAEAQRVFAHIHARSPNMLTINNDFSSAPVDDEDVMSLEDFGKICSPDFDFASGTWVGPGNKEFAFKIKWDWFYVGQGSPEWEGYELNYANVPDNASIVKRIATIIGSSWNAHLGYGPLIGGDFPELLNDFTDHFSRFMAWAEESIYCTVGGGYGQGGFPPGHWNDGAYGVTTLVPAGQTHYIHVLSAPRNEALILPDAGYEVLEATELKTGSVLEFTQSKGLLMIKVPSWQGVTTDGDIVIKLTTSGSRRLIPVDRIVATASSEAADQPAAHVLDGSYETIFYAGNDAEWPLSITLQLDGEYEVCGLTVLQPEAGAVIVGGYAAPEGERIKDYCLHLSRDGVNWGEPVQQGALHNQRGLQVILFAPEQASFVRFTVSNNHSGTNTLRIIQLDVVSVHEH